MNERLQQAAGHYAARDYNAAAEAACRALIDDEPRQFDALHLLGVLLTVQNLPADAPVYLRRARAERPDHAQLRVNLGNALLATKQFEEAVAVSRGAACCSGASRRGGGA